MATTPDRDSSRSLPATFVPLSEAARIMGCSIRTLQRLIDSGDLPGYRFGPRLVRVRLADLERAMTRIPASR